MTITVELEDIDTFFSRKVANNEYCLQPAAKLDVMGAGTAISKSAVHSSLVLVPI